MFKLQSPSKYSPFDAIHLLRHFFLLLKTVFEFVNFNAFYCFCQFLFHLVHISKGFPLMTLFSKTKQNKTKATWGNIRQIERVGHGRYVVFGQKLLNTHHGVGRSMCPHKSPIMKWANMLKESSEKIH